MLTLNSGIKAIASDYDGTIATHGKVSQDTVAALRRWRESGGALWLVTGREVVDLVNIFPELELFSWIVAENGATLYEVAEQRETLLTEPPPEHFIRELEQRGIGPLYVGRVIVAAAVSEAPAVQQAIDDLGVPLHIILNKEALMVLPKGVNKAHGLRALLARLAISADAVAGVGDGENDVDLLAMCGFPVAPQNAIPELKQMAGYVTEGEAGQGFIELVDGLLEGSLTPRTGAGTPSTTTLQARWKPAR